MIQAGQVFLLSRALLRRWRGGILIGGTQPTDVTLSFFGGALRVEFHQTARGSSSASSWVADLSGNGVVAQGWPTGE